VPGEQASLTSYDRRVNARGGNDGSRRDDGHAYDVARARATGTHQGDFMGMPATGKRIEVQLVDIIRFGDDGLAREHWGVFDTMTMMQQLGVIPEDAPA
jgi:hypothetical protein